MRSTQATSVQEEIHEQPKPPCLGKRSRSKSAKGTAKTIQTEKPSKKKNRGDFVVSPPHTVIEIDDSPAIQTAVIENVVNEPMRGAPVEGKDALDAVTDLHMTLAELAITENTSTTLMAHEESKSVQK